MPAIEPGLGAAASAQSAWVYLDASALVALLAIEPRSAGLRQWMNDNESTPLVSADWCVTEVASALSQKVRTRQWVTDVADAAWAQFGAACDGLLTLIPVEASDFAAAAELCRQPPSTLRAGDALHLAVAMRAGCGAMLCFDDILNKNAQARGLAVISP